MRGVRDVDVTVDEAPALDVDGRRPPTAVAVKELAALCDRVEDGGPAVAVLRVTGAPAADWTDGLDTALVTKWERTLRRFERLPAVTVAVAAGDTGGTALDAFLTADLRLAAPGTRLVLPSDGEATWPGMAVLRLVRLLGAGRARRAVLFGDPIDAEQALALGLADTLTAAPEATLAALTTRYAAHAGTELAVRRQLLLDAATTPFEDALGSHLAACDRALRRHPTQEPA
ncbi:enoyl-CoA-hydratase DpgB [Streptomyces shenzhenensis]|uniref:enoyl-CoA-hydratase DpgB n=1 Tax=Streptomyces TaxID=1883 RepID=UPI001F2AF87F|nr:enoyl-CoA-hydratase DpgB [Streptomyces shenzhenensis]